MNLFSVIPQDLSTTASPTFAEVNITDKYLLSNSGLNDEFYLIMNDSGSPYVCLTIAPGPPFTVLLGDITGYEHSNHIEIDDVTIFLNAPGTTVSGTLSVAGNVAIGSDATINSLYPLYYATTLSPDTPGASVYVFANNLLDWSTNGNSTGGIVGHRVNLRWQPDSLSGTASDVYVTDYFLSANWGSANITNAYILRCLFNQFSFGYTGTITNLFGAYLNLDPVSGQTPVTNAYGLYIENVDASATTNYSIYTNAGTVRFGDDVVIADGKNIVLDTSTGTQIGTGTSQLLGFFGATPVNQPDTVSDAATQDLTGTDTVDKTKLEADLTSVKNAVNTVIDRLQELGLVA